MAQGAPSSADCPLADPRLPLPAPSPPPPAARRLRQRVSFVLNFTAIQPPINKSPALYFRVQALNGT